MKAALYESNGAPDRLRFIDLPDPVAGPGELLMAVEAISIEGGDLMARRAVPPGTPPQVKGYVAAGRVLALGEGTSGFAVGDRVTSFAAEGSHASLRVAPASQCWLVPDGLEMSRAAAALVTLGTAGLALETGGLKPGHTVLVLGAAGGVGLAAVQIAARAGARVIGTGSDANSLALLAPFGLTDAIVASPGEASLYLRDLLDGDGVDLVIDAVGGRATGDGLKALRDGGRLVLVGLFDRDGAGIDPIDLLVRRLTISGCFLGPVISQPEVREMIATLLERAAKGGLRVPIDCVFPLSAAAAAHARAEERGRVGRVIMVP